MRVYQADSDPFMKRIVELIVLVWSPVLDQPQEIRSLLIMAKAAAAKKAAPKAAPKSAAGKQAVITLKHLAAESAEAHDLPKKQVETILTEVIASIGKQLKKGAKIRLVGLGILQVRKRAARMGRNPATGEAIKIKASKKIAFRAAKELKESV
jgi:DNA-binding protein HU-beta